MLLLAVAIALVIVILSGAAVPLGFSVPIAEDDRPPLTYGVRPFWLIEHMSPGKLRDELRACRHQKPRRALFSIGHRGAPMQFPEHTRESYVAAAQLGAGVLECDVTFTRDKALVCRHSQCDLHTTTNVLLTPLGAKCSEPFRPATNGTKASARCCTTDFTLAEFKSLRGKMDASYAEATTVEEYVNLGTPRWRTDLYATEGTLLTHAEAIALFLELGVQMTPELKPPMVPMPYGTLNPERPGDDAG